MAGKLNVQESREVRELKQFELTNVKFTGKKLGEGSYGSVEVVEIPGAKCAAKTIHELLVQFMPTQSVQSKDYTPRSLIEGFITECTLMSKLKHPHIVQFMGISYPPGAKLPALVMELLMTSLHEYLESAADIPMSIKHNILLGVSKGVVFLHSLDVVHRDLTARNILLSTSLDAKIADLGMARLLNIQVGRHAATMTKGPGNACYMPPEAKDGDVVTYGKPIDTFSMGNLILFTITQDFPDPKNPAYYDNATHSTKARTEIERRETSFQLLWEMIGKDHPLSFLTAQCLQDGPFRRPTAVEIQQQLEGMPSVPYRDWSASKHDLIQNVLENELTVHNIRDEMVSLVQKNAQLQQENAQVVQDHQREIQEKQHTISQLRYVEFKQQQELVERDSLLDHFQRYQQELVAQIEEMKLHNAAVIAMKSKTTPDTMSMAGVLKPQETSMASPQRPRELEPPTPVDREDIVKAILSIRVGPGQPLYSGTSQEQQPRSMGHNMPQNSDRRGSAPAISRNMVRGCFNGGNGGGHYQNIADLLDPSVVREVRERQELEGTEQQEQYSTNVNLDISRRPPTSGMYETVELNQRQQEESRQSYVSSLNLPEPIVHTVDELERLQATSSDGGYNALSLLTDLLDPSVVREVRERQELEGTEQQEQYSTNVNLDISRRPPTSGMYELNQRQQEESRQSYVSSLNLPEPIVHTVDELERLQATSSDGGYNALSLLTDARSDPVGYSGPSFDSLISYQTLNAAVEDEDYENSETVENTSTSKPHTSPLSSLEKNSLNLDTFEIVDDSCISSSSNIASAARSFESPSQPPVHEKISGTLPISSTQTGGNKDLSLPPAPHKRSNALPLGAIDPSSPRLRSQMSQQRSFERDTNQGANASNLDRHPMKRDKRNRLVTLEQFPAKLSILTRQKPDTAETPALVEGTWTCNCCLNIVFGNATDCDVCGNPRH